MKKGLVILLLAALALTGCSKEKAEKVSAKYENTEEAFETLETAVKKLDQEEGVSLQVFGSMSSTYHDASSMIGISALHSENKSDGKVNSVMTISYTDGSYVDYYSLSDGEQNIRYSRFSGSEAETETGGEDESDEMKILSEEEFEKAVRYGGIQLLFSTADIQEVIREVTDSSVSWKFVIDPLKGETLAVWLLEAISYIDMTQTNITFSINEIACKAGYNDDGDLKTIKYELDADMTCEGETLHADYSVSYVVVSKGAEVEVSVPELSGLTESESQEGRN